MTCRFVEKEFAEGDPVDDLFTGAPPLFAARLLLTKAASSGLGHGSLMVLDISRAFICARGQDFIH